jgi:steroid 5-alpha reductase family enzyme
MLVLLWALRLGTFLFIRIRKLKKDARFDGMREKFFVFLRFWLLQGITVFIILVPSILLWHQTVTKIGWLAIVGVVVFGLGLLLEATADIQKYQFYTHKKSDTWIDNGVWRISRHPNYLGEIMVWLGVYLFVVISLSTNQKLLALIGPIYITALLLFVSGIPLLEKSANKKWGAIKAYQTYKNKVPVLVPSFSSFRRILKNK